MKETLQMTFSTTGGKNRIMSVANPRAGLTPSIVNTAADMIINANPFDVNIGALVELLRTRRVSVVSQSIISPPAA
ncbi:MAG: DUF2922 domain-containing protein [Defluviitaleaceae bacterium]|nr:DUF2922 domain-containing protein [Defluviitaleaceae bacterium]